jgi:hypothetical protein
LQPDAGAKVAKEIGAVLHMQVSALTMKGVKELFESGERAHGQHSAPLVSPVSGLVFVYMAPSPPWLNIGPAAIRIVSGELGSAGGAAGDSKSCCVLL